MLHQQEDKLVCPHCERVWAPDDKLRVGDPCPASECPSHEMKHYAIVLQLRTRALVLWEGLAKDMLKAEHDAIKAQHAQVYQIISTTEIKS